MDASQPQQSPRRSWRLLLAVALGNAIVLGYFLAPQTVGEQLRRQLKAELQAHYPHLDVRIGSGRLAGHGGVVLEGIELRTVPRRWGERSVPIVKVGRLEVLGKIELERLKEGKNPIRPYKVIAWEVVAELWKDPQGQWSPELIWPPLRMEDECPRIEVRGGKLRIHRDDRLEQRPLDIDQIDANLDLVTASAAATQSHAGDRPLEVRFEVRAAAAFLDAVSLRGELIDGKLQLTGEAGGVRLDPSVTQSLPRGLVDRWQELQRLSLLVDLRYELEGQVGTGSARARPGDPPGGIPAHGRATSVWEGLILPDDESDQPGGPWNYSVDGLVRDGRFEHEWLPQPLERLRGQFSLHPQGIDVLAAEARLGEAELRLSATSRSWSETADWDGRLTAKGLKMNASLAEKLPGRVGTVWEELRPQGVLDVDVAWMRRAGEWSSRGTTQLHGVDVEWAEFPYPVAQLLGTVEFDESGARSQGLVGRVGGRQVSIAFDHDEEDSDHSNWLELACDGPVPIDAALVGALTPRGESESGLECFVRSLTPAGQIHLVTARWDHDGTGKPRQRIDLKVTGGTLRYEGFPYPLYDVRGQIVVEDDLTRLIGFQAGNSDYARIHCEGYFWDDADAVIDRAADRGTGDAVGRAEPPGQSPEAGWRLELRFQARDLPLDEALRAALASDSRAIWDNLSPTGVLDYTEVAVQHHESWEEPRILISARQGAKPTIDNRTISLRPADIPYRIDLVEGAMRYDGDMVWIDSLDGRHDSTRISAEGRCQRTESGRWRMDLNVHSGSRLHLDAELIGSLPAQVRGGIQRLQLRGPLSARGRVGVWLPDSQFLEPAFDWDMILQLEGNRIGDVGMVQDLRGEITMRGTQDPKGAFAEGLVSIDSMHIGSQQITAIRGPYEIRDGLLLLGEAIPSPAKSARGATSLPPVGWGAARNRALNGKVYGGTASLSGEVLLTDGSFDVVLAIVDADLATMLRELGQADSSVRGKAEGQVRLEGMVGANHLLKGAGSAKISQANLYQLPLLISVFNLLRVKPSESVAFTDGTTRFTVYGDQVTFNELKLWGDLIALDGTGTMNRSLEVNLTFNTKVSPHNVWSYVASPFGQDRYTLWTLNVRGSLANPQIDRRGIEAVGGTLERLLPGIAGQGDSDRQASDRWRWLNRWNR